MTATPAVPKATGRYTEGIGGLPNTEAVRGLETGASPNDPDFIREFQNKFDRDEVVDTTALSDGDRARYGFKPEEKQTWVRDPARWKGMGDIGDRVRDVTNSCGGRVVHDEHGEPLRHGDLICMAIHRRIGEIVQDKIDSKLAVRDAMYEDTGEMGIVSTETGTHTKADREMVLQQKRKTAAMLHSLGVNIDSSPTKGLSFAEAARLMKSRGVDPVAMAEKARRGNQHKELTRTAWQAMLRENSRASFAVGETGIGMTTEQKVRSRKAGKGA